MQDTQPDERLRQTADDQPIVQNADLARVGLCASVKPGQAQGMADEAVQRIPVLRIEEVCPRAAEGKDIMLFFQSEPAAQMAAPDALGERLKFGIETIGVHAVIVGSSSSAAVCTGRSEALPRSFVLRGTVMAPCRPAKQSRCFIVGLGPTRRIAQAGKTANRWT
jgi:hypothetical protein